MENREKEVKVLIKDLILRFNFNIRIWKRRGEMGEEEKKEEKVEERKKD